MLKHVSASLPSALGVLLATGSAYADTSTWYAASAGPLLWKQGQDSTTESVAMAIDAGVGTRPDGKFIVGGLFRLMPVLGEGTDIALLLRLTHRGFQSGVGLALDAGGYERFWGQGSQGFVGALTLGGPLGLMVSGQLGIGTNDALAYGGFAGIDLARLTVHRGSLLEFWHNPDPKPTNVGTASGQLRLE